MNTRKTIYDKLFNEKVELAKHEVNLGVVDDLKKLASISASQLKTNKNIITVIVGIVDSINAKLKELDKNDIDNLSLQKSSETIYNNFKKAAQDLGIDYKNTEGFKLHEEILSNALKMNDKKMIISSIKTLIR